MHEITASILQEHCIVLHTLRLDAFYGKLLALFICVIFIIYTVLLAIIGTHEVQVNDM